MEQFKLKRTGNAPVQFAGELIAEASGKWQNGREHTRWHDLALYRTDKGQFVLSVEYHTQWQGEADFYYVDTIADEAELRERLTTWESIKDVVWFPAGSHYAEKQAKLLNDIANRFATRASEILDDFPEEI